MKSENYWQRVTSKRISRRRTLIAGGAGIASAAFLAACGGDDESPSGTGSTGNTGSTGGTSGITGGSGATGANSLITQPVDTTDKAVRGGTLPYYATNDITSFDPSTSNIALNEVSTTVYARMTKLALGHLEPWVFEVVPDMAESWEWSPDRLQLTMKLRPGVKFHDKAPVSGRLLDAEDIAFSWNRFATMSPSRATMANVANPNAPIIDVTATDSSTVVVKLAEPVSYLLAFFANSVSGYVSVLPKEADSSIDLRQQQIGTGPFMLDNYEPSVGFTLKRNMEYYDPKFPLVDEIQMPILTEYSQAIAQLKAGNILTYLDVRNEDVVSIQKEASDLLMYQSEILVSEQKTSFGWLPAGESPFGDIRVRQALSMSYDRDLWIDTFHNVSGFEELGLPIEVAWNSHLPRITGWSNDPRDAAFGPNAKYFQYNVEEAKKLMEAAGYSDGLDVVSSYIGGAQYGTDYQTRIAVLEDMARQVGFNPIANVVDLQTEFIPKYRDKQGQHEGWTYRQGPRPSQDPVHRTEFDYYSKGGTNFAGFDVTGAGDKSGDPEVDRMLLKARAEIDDDARRATLFELESYLGEKMYNIRWPGGTSGFTLAWPALGNVEVWRGDTDTIRINNWWVDTTRKPLA